MSCEDTSNPTRCSSPKTITLNSSPNQSSDSLNGPIAIFWDIENCPIPVNVRPEDIAVNIRTALRVNPVINGPVTRFSAYGDFNAFPPRLRQGCQRTGVKLIDVPSGRKDAADKAILVDMFLFALDNRPPSSILLISGDVDFAPALHILGQRGYTVILVIPSRLDVSSALANAGRFVWDWNSVARGGGFVPRNSNFGHEANGPNEDEATVVNKGDKKLLSQRNTRDMHAIYCSSSPIRHMRSRDFVSENPKFEHGWDGLNREESTVLGKGSNKLCHVKNARDVHNFGSCSSPVRILRREDHKDKGLVEELFHKNMRSSSDESLDDDEESDDQFDGLRQEVQELFLSYGHLPVPLNVFESLYVQRYKKSLNFERFGVVRLEELIAKVQDVVMLFEDQASKKKFIRLAFAM